MTAVAFTTLRATYVECWPAAWRTVALPSVAVGLDAEIVRALLRRNTLVARAGWTPADPTPLAPSLQRLVETLDGLGAVAWGTAAGAFVRLGSRSAKDGARGLTLGQRVATGLEAVDLLTSGSARVVYDLRLAVQHGHTPHVVVRPWQEWTPWVEVRCFVAARRLVGITRVERDRSPGAAARGAGGGGDSARLHADVHADVHARVAPIIYTMCTAASSSVAFVADIVLPPLREAETGRAAWLLDVNPFAPVTDPGRFTWTLGGDFDGSVRL